MNKADPEGVNEWDTVRDMGKVWAALPAFGAHNTLLLDNEARKFRDAPRNGIVVPEFGPAEVRSRAAHTLDALKGYLLQLAEAAPPDVRAYLAARPFGAAAPQQPKAAPSLADALEALSLRPDTNVRRTTASSSVDAAPPAPAPPSLADVPRGTALHFVCLDAGRVTLRSGAAQDVSVVLDTNAAAAAVPRIEAKMDFHRLLADAKEARTALEVSVRGVRVASE
jgi:hypothetical protein